MKRRTFIRSVGAAFVGTTLPALAHTERESARVLLRSARPAGYFPHISGPQILPDSKVPIALMHGRTRTLLNAGTKQIAFESLDCARMIRDAHENIQIVGWRRNTLVHLQLKSSGDLTTARLAERAQRYPAIGLSAVFARGELLIAAPGEDKRSLALYSSRVGMQRVVTHSRWVHPLLAFDSNRGRLHLVFCPWAELSSLYSTVQYLRSDDFGGNWTRSNGLAVATPFKPAPAEHGNGGVQPEIISVHGQPTGGFAHTLAHQLSLDREGNPHLLYSFCRPYHIAGGPAQREKRKMEPRLRTMFVRWNGTEWKSSELAADWSVDVAGGAFDWDERGRIHALVMFKDKDAHWLDLGHTMSEDQGATWQGIRPITTDAAPNRMHYLAPSLCKNGRDFEFLCTSYSEQMRSNIYEGRLEP